MVIGGTAYALALDRDSRWMESRSIVGEQGWVPAPVVRRGLLRKVVRGRDWADGWCLASSKRFSCSLFVRCAYILALEKSGRQNWRHRGTERKRLVKWSVVGNLRGRDGLGSRWDCGFQGTGAPNAPEKTCNRRKDGRKMDHEDQRENCGPVEWEGATGWCTEVHVCNDFIDDLQVYGIESIDDEPEEACRIRHDQDGTEAGARSMGSRNLEALSEHGCYVSC